MVIVVDANVFVNALAYAVPDDLLVLKNEHKGVYTFAMSDKMREEILHVIIGHLFESQIEEEKAKQAFKVICRCLHRTVQVDSLPIVKYSSHGPDNEFISCAIEASATHLVTNNTKHFQKEIKTPILNKSKCPINIVTPEEFNLAILNKMYR